MDGTRRLTLREAAGELGVSVEAVRKRVKRHSLRSDKDPDGKVYVYLDASGDEYHPQVQGEAPALVGELRDRVRFLEGQLEQANERDRENRRIIAALTSRIPELEAPAREESPDASRGGSGGAPREEAPLAHEGAQEGAEPRSWWRRVFGS